MFGMRENGELDPLRYDGHLDAPQGVARMLADLVPVGARVLDVGCGTGSVSRIIAGTRNAKIIGIEPNSRRAAAARARGLEVYEERFTPAVLQLLEPFDVITSRSASATRRTFGGLPQTPSDRSSKRTACG